VNPLQRWTEQALGELGLPADVLDQDAVLEVTKNVAHQVARPAAPLTAFLLGVAVGRGADPTTSAQAMNALAARWSAISSEAPADAAGHAPSQAPNDGLLDGAQDLVRTEPGRGT
jgi:hypothetical protein